jgi:hypothetical protein
MPAEIKFFFSKLFKTIISVGTVHMKSVFSDNNLLSYLEASHNIVEIRDFLIFLLVDGRIRILILTWIRMSTNNHKSGQRRPEKLADLEHWKKLLDDRLFG